MTTPEPVSPAPDTEALRQQVARELYRADGLNGNASHDPWDEPSQKVHLRYLALAADGVLPLLAGLLADLDRAHIERDKLCREVDRLTASGDRPIPDDAAVDVVARRLFQAHVSNSYGAVRAERMWNITLDDTDRDFWRNHAREALAEAGLSTPTTDPAPAAADGVRQPHEAEVDNAVAGALLDVYGFVPLDVRYKAARYARKVVADWLEAVHHTEAEPAAPQAPAEPTAVYPDADLQPSQMDPAGTFPHATDFRINQPADLAGMSAREDSAHPTTQDGDTPTRPTREEA